MISGDSRVQRGLLHRRRAARRTNVVGGVNNGWAVAMTLLGYERGEAAATMPDPVPGRARPPARAGPGARRRRRPAHPPAPGVVLLARSRSCATSGMRTLTQFLAGHHPGPGRRDLQAVLERVPPASSPSWPSTSSAPTRWCPTGRPPSIAFQTDDAGAPNSSASWVGTFLNARAGTIYAGYVADPAQHHRRDGARPARRSRRRRRRHVGRAAGAPGLSARGGGRRGARRPSPVAVADGGAPGRRALVPAGLVAAAAVPARARPATTSRFRMQTSTATPITPPSPTTWSPTSRGAATWPGCRRRERAAADHGGARR